MKSRKLLAIPLAAFVIVHGTEIGFAQRAVAPPRLAPAAPVSSVPIRTLPAAALRPAPALPPAVPMATATPRVSAVPLEPASALVLQEIAVPVAVVEVRR